MSNLYNKMNIKPLASAPWMSSLWTSPPIEECTHTEEVEPSLYEHLIGWCSKWAGPPVYHVKVINRSSKKKRTFVENPSYRGAHTRGKSSHKGRKAWSKNL